MNSLFRALSILLLCHVSLCKVVREVLTLTWEEGAPNGQVREMVKMNGQFPGPNFIWEEDDDIEVYSLGSFHSDRIAY
jgi:hypothetical protein